MYGVNSGDQFWFDLTRALRTTKGVELPEVNCSYYFIHFVLTFFFLYFISYKLTNNYYLLLTGQETTSNQLSFTLYEILKHPRIEERYIAQNHFS